MRRAQVREAQKAYRSRQQTQLSSLKARVEQLEDVLTHLSRTMHAFDNQISQRGPQWSQPELLRTVQSLREDIVHQLKRAEIKVEEPQKNPTAESSRTVDEQPHAQVAPEASLARTRDSTTESDFWALFLGSSAGILPSTNQSTVGQSTDLVPVPGTPSVAETYTIQYATTPFTQRLFRACVESGYFFLSNSLYKDEDMWQFKLLLQRMPRAEIKEYFKRVSSVEPCNPVIDARFPYICLGRSGTYFLQSDNDLVADRLAHFRTTNGVSHVPSDEEWFDVHDVERYLLNQGIRVGNFPSSNLLTNHPYNANSWPLDLVNYHGTTPGSVMMVIDEYELVNGEHPLFFLPFACIQANLTRAESLSCCPRLCGWVPPV